jgi:adenine-specific DNA-methyltransferase
MEKLKMHSPNLTQGNIARIRDLFPNCITETKAEDGSLKLVVDFDQLRQELTDFIVEGPQERYHLNWPGKREALLAANAPIAKTLRPVRDESVDFDTTKNLFIEGDNLDALKLLQETYLGKVKMIYIDPPYNTGNDFIYEDDFAESETDFLRRSNQKDEEGNRLVANTASNGRFHSDWLTMMYPRLKLARNLLRDDGVIFISIGDSEVTNTQKLCDDTFGSQNCIGIVPRLMKSGGNKGRFFSPNIDYIIIYAKDIELTGAFKAELDEELVKKLYNKTETQGLRRGEKYRPFGLYQSSLDSRPNQRYFIECPDGTLVIPPGSSMPSELVDGCKVVPESNDGCWRWSQERYFEEKAKNSLVFIKSSNDVLITPAGTPSKWNVYTKIWLSDRHEEGQTPINFISKFENRHSAKELAALGINFDFAKPVGLIKYLTSLIDDTKNSIILDFFSGSATTAHAALELNAEDGGERRYVLVQLPEPCSDKSEAFKAGYKSIAEIGKERIRRAGKKIVERGCHEKWSKDIGFRVLKIDTSNMADVYYAPDALDKAKFDLFVDNIKPDRTPEDLLFQVMLDWGVDLALPIIKQSIQGKDVFFVDGNALAACFDASGSIDEVFVKELAKQEPLRVVFRDAGYKDSAVKINVEQIFKLLSPATEVKCI